MRDVVRALGKQRWFAAAGRRTLHHVDGTVFRLTGRTISDLLFPTLVLHTMGRRSGQERSVPVLYLKDGDCYIVFGSGWGQRVHPGWSQNLVANPDARITVAGRTHRVRARLAKGMELELLGQRARAVWPAYDKYREWAAHREIRAFVLEPA